MYSDVIAPTPEQVLTGLLEVLERMGVSEENGFWSEVSLTKGVEGNSTIKLKIHYAPETVSPEDTILEEVSAEMPCEDCAEHTPPQEAELDLPLDVALTRVSGSLRRTYYVSASVLTQKLLEAGIVRKYTHPTFGLEAYAVNAKQASHLMAEQLANPASVSTHNPFPYPSSSGTQLIYSFGSLQRAIYRDLRQSASKGKGEDDGVLQYADPVVEDSQLEVVFRQVRSVVEEHERLFNSDEQPQDDGVLSVLDYHEAEHPVFSALSKELSDLPDAQKGDRMRHILELAVSNTFPFLSSVEIRGSLLRAVLPNGGVVLTQLQFDPNTHHVQFGSGFVETLHSTVKSASAKMLKARAPDGRDDEWIAWELVIGEDGAPYLVPLKDKKEKKS